MNDDIFEKAMVSMMFASDYQEYIETGNSFIMDKLLDLGFNQDTAEVTFRQLGFLEQRAFGAYAECFEHFGVVTEFEEWGQQEGVFQRIHANILEALEEMKDKKDIEDAEDIQFFC